MQTQSNWTITPNKVLNDAELAMVLERTQAIAYRKRHNLNGMINLCILRLGAYAGLRASEMSGLKLSDIVLVDTKNKSYIKVSKEFAKGSKARHALIWSDNTVQDLQNYMDLRISQGASPDSPFLCSMSKNNFGAALTRHTIRLRAKTACKVLGKERVRSITAHTLRHVYCSKALSDGVPLALVRDSAGHSSIQITNTYAHVWTDSDADWSMD